MSHDTHQDTHHAPATEARPIVSFRSSFWFVIILAGLFIAAVNFVSIMSHDDGGHGEGHGTEHAAPAHGEVKHEEATSHGTHDATPTATEPSEKHEAKEEAHTEGH